MFKRLLTIIAVPALLLGAGGASLALANGGGPPPDQNSCDYPEEHMIEHRDALLDALNANETQRAAITEVANTLRAESEAQRAAREADYKTLVSWIGSDSLDPDVLENLRAKRVAEMEAMSMTLTEKLTTAAELLTPEQRKQLVNLLANPPGSR